VFLAECPEFAPTWAGDTRRRLFVNLEQLKLSVMFSVTAPGADLFPFDSQFCSHRPVHRCSGVLGCRVNPEAAEAFNRNVGKWWSELHRAAKLRADRETGFKGWHTCTAYCRSSRLLTFFGRRRTSMRFVSWRRATPSASSTAGRRSAGGSGLGYRRPRTCRATSPAGAAGKCRSRRTCSRETCRASSYSSRVV